MLETPVAEEAKVAADESSVETTGEVNATPDHNYNETLTNAGENSDTATVTEVADEPEANADATHEGVVDVAEMEFGDFLQMLEAIGIDPAEHKESLEEFAEQCGMLGITDILNNDDLDDEKKETAIIEALFSAEEISDAAQAFGAITSFVVEQLKLDGSSTQDFFKGGFGRLIDALIRGAGHNSSSAMRTHETNNSAEVVGTGPFFDKIKEKPRDVIEGIIDNATDLKKVGWDISPAGIELLKKGKDNDKDGVRALQAVLVGEGQDNITSLAEHLNNKVDHNAFWGEVSPILAKTFGEEKTMLSLNIKDLIQDMGSGREEVTHYFGKP
ncbi:MAG: hypothetical protein HN846_03420 [Candidatus Pacebacteria bacterium]|nr:hypothetical protein [Candidatus Paceibacterota bacterium]MBT3512133.1 hypothetical protein [Candidatus Paceibacterota bacterium]MBT4005405.1 hypothetical protein [Candidatus Paceibacterota bacterium]MBT4359114.1 hypothetical protein [Candidatus Paceibacterota bacterium]MBT4680969.1 hypothetical protein [Candidatus Paceibacterota bacterium]